MYSFSLQGDKNINIITSVSYTCAEGDVSAHDAAAQTNEYAKTLFQKCLIAVHKSWHTQDVDERIADYVSYVADRDNEMNTMYATCTQYVHVYAGGKLRRPRYGTLSETREASTK